VGIRSRFGALVAMATLVLTPAVRLACLAMCAAPAAMHAAAVAPSFDGRPSSGTAAAHAHHHQQADAAPPATATAADAAARPVGGARCDTARGSICTDAASVVPRPTLRAAADDVAITPLRARLPNAASTWRPHRALPPIRVAPPGPPPASTPLRV
jgi:hypothetical protein